MTAHWASPLVGEPWTPQRNCWWLVREVFRRRHGLSMPEHAAGVPALLEAARGNGWARAEGEPRPDDVVVMAGPTGRHVGVLVEANGGMLLMHSNGHMTDRGPVGAVVLQSLQDAASGGYEDFELWRKS